MSLIMMARAACRGPASVAQSISIAPDDDTVSVVQGGTVQIVYTLTRVGGYSGTVTPAVTGLPSGVSGAWSDSSLTGGDTTTTLTLTATGGATEVTNDAFTVTFSGSGVSDAVDAGTVTVTASGSYDVDLSFERLASGSGTTLIDDAIPLEEGDLFAADIANASVDANGSEIGVWLEARGLYPDGSMRALGIQASLSMTFGTPITGGLRLTGGFSVSRLSHTDASAYWTNTNTTTWHSGTAGVPPGIVSSTSATQLCAAMAGFWPGLTPKSGQPSFTNSTAVDSTFDAAYTTTLEGWNGTFPYGGAQYDRATYPLQEWGRTADSSYKVTAYKFMARMKSAYWASAAGGLPENEQSWESYAMMVLLRGDTDAETWLRSAGSTVPPNWLPDWYAYGPRYNARSVRCLVALHWIGHENTANNHNSTTFAEILENQVLPLIVEEGTTKMFYLDECRLPGYASDGATPTTTTYPYMTGIFLDAMIAAAAVLPSSANRTTMLQRILDATQWLYDNSRSTNGAGKITHVYSTAALYNALRNITCSGGYTSGTSITVAGLPANTGFGVGSITFGGNSRDCDYFSTNGSGVATITIASGFPGSISNGASGTYIEQVAGAGGGGEIDLNGFFPHLFAYLGWKTVDSAMLDYAEDLYGTIAGTPQDGTNGPYLSAGKQMDEAFHRSKQIMGYLKAAGR